MVNIFFLFWKKPNCYADRNSIITVRSWKKKVVSYTKVAVTVPCKVFSRQMDLSVTVIPNNNWAAWIAWSLQRQAAGCTSRASDPGGCEVFPCRSFRPRGLSASRKWVSGYSQGESGQSVVMATHLLLVPGSKWVEIKPPPSLFTCSGISWGDMTGWYVGLAAKPYELADLLE